VIRRLFWLGVILFALTAAAVIVQAGMMDRRHGQGRSLAAPVDVTIVLAGSIEPDDILSYPSRRRVAAGVALLQAGQTRRLMMSGGRYRFGSPSLAAKMRDYAVSLGADAGLIDVEEASATTFENVRFAIPQARAGGAARICLEVLTPPGNAP